jgi:sulfatase maturation enzyme AslB (radical SAM superfamily)
MVANTAKTYNLMRTYIMLNEYKINRALNMKRQGLPKKKYLDFCDPFYGEKISYNHIFSVDSIIDIPANTIALLTIRDEKEKIKILDIPFFFSYDFVLSDILVKYKKYIKINKAIYKYFDFESGIIQNGTYSVLLRIQFNHEIHISRRHKFVIVNNENFFSTKNNQKFCVNAWRTTLVREYGVMPCCNLKRREKVLYNSQYDSFYDPWNNRGFQKIREEIAKGSAKYCHPGCRALTDKPESIESFYPHKGFELFAETPSYLKELYNDYLNGRSVMKSGPLEISIHMGNACNLKCIFCILPQKETYHTIYSNNILSLIKKYGKNLSILRLVGGEPLLYLNHLNEICNYISNHTTIEFTTNGILLEKLKKYDNYKFSIKVSLNTANKETYKWLHGHDYFDRVVGNIMHLNEYISEYRIMIKFIIMKSTYKQIVDFAKLAINLKVNSCLYGILLIKDNASISLNEKITFDENEWHEANKLLCEAERMLKNAGINFKFSGWDYRPDDFGTLSELDEIYTQ